MLAEFERLRYPVVVIRTNRTILGLMIPFFSLVLNLSMFTVALPGIRDAFGLAADTASWVVLAYTIPYVACMPLHGRLGDLFGPRKVLIAGIGVYAIGTVICMVAPNLAALVVGRIVQGAGGAGLNPLALTIIAREFPLEDRGRAMGTWNAAGPLTGMIGPTVAGFLIDAFSWRTIFLPMVVAQVFGAISLLALVPRDPRADDHRRPPGGFDWPGMVLTAATLLSFVLFLSSRPVTGRAPFTDWRLGLLFVASAVGWVLWEHSRENPFVAIGLFRRPQFSIASGSVAARMLLMGGAGFLVPLFAADVLGIPSTETGIIITINSTALLLTMRFGGRLADIWQRRWAVVIGLGGQTAMVLVLALVPGATLLSLVIPFTLHGGFAGLSLASLHHVAMHEIPGKKRGIGAATYSMTRFVGSLLGASVMGVVLEAGLSNASTVQAAYQQSFLVAALLGLLGVMPALGIRRAS